MRSSIPFTSHRLGLNCGSSPFRDVMEHLGFRFTEDMIFGLGSGLNLAYHHGDASVPDRHWRAPLTIITGRSIAPYAEAASVLGVQLYARRNLDDRTAAEHLLDDVGRGVPVVCEIDREEMLPLVRQENLLTRRYGFRFGGHKTIVIACDEEANTATIVENMLPEPVVVPLDMLGRMRSSPAALYPPENAYFVVSPPRRLQRLEVAIPMAIAKNVQTMRCPEYRGTGLSAVDWFADEVCAWPELLSAERLEASILMAWMQSEHLSGGGMYRNMYARFLRQADDVLGDPILVRAAATYRSLARRWSQLVVDMLSALREDRLTDFSSAAMRENVTAIARREHEAVELLEVLVARWFRL